MEERFKVLSIDFDFFQNTTKDILVHYPDGVDVPSEISTIVWGSYYVGPKKEIIESVTLNRGLFCQMMAILSKLRSDIPVKIANSHVNAYDFIHQYRNGKEVAVFNVDLHHDLFNDNPELDCGNWLKHLKDDLPETNMTIQTYQEDGKSIFTGFSPNSDSFMANLESTYNVVGDMMFQKTGDRYFATRLTYSPNGNSLGDILTTTSSEIGNYSNQMMI